MTRLSKHIFPIPALLLAGWSVLPATAQSLGDLDSPLPAGYITRALMMDDTDNPWGTVDQLSRFETLTGTTDMMLSAKAYYAVGDDRCVPLLRDFIAANPASPQATTARMLLGDFYFFSHDFPEALLEYNLLDIDWLSTPDRAQYTYRKALCLLKTGYIDKAVPLLNRLRNTEKYAAPAQFYLAYVDYRNGKYDDAYDGFAKALEMLGQSPDTSRQTASSPNIARRHAEYTPTGLEAGYYMLQIDFKRGEYQKVINSGPTLIAKTPVPELTPEIRRIVGESYFKLGNNDQAQTWLSDYLAETDSPAPSAYYILGVIAYDNRNYDEAADYFGRLRDENNDLGQSAYLYLGQCAVNQHEPDLAAISFRKAYEMNFDSSVAETALYNYIAAVTRGGNVPFASSVPLLQEFVDRYPKSQYAPAVEQYMAVAYYNEKDFDNALTSINRISRPDAKVLAVKQKILFELGVREMSNDRPAQAEKYLQEAMTLASSDRKVAAQTALWLGDALYAQKKYAEADKAYASYLKGDAKGDNSALAKYNMAYSLYMQDKFKDALALFDDALNGKPALPATLATDALMRKADCLYYLGNLNTAAATYAEAIADGSADADYAAMRQAVIAGVNGDNRSKITQLDAMMAKYPSSKWIATAMLEKALAYAELNESQKAIDAFDELARKYPDSPETRNALLQMALLYRTNGNTDAAVEAYKTIITKWVTSEEAQVAGDDLRAIYASRGQLADLAEFLKSVPGAPQLDDNEVEQLTYDDASTTYATTNDISKLRNYVSRYPDGRYLAQALRDIAEYEYIDMDDADTALATIADLLDRRPDAQQVPGALLLKGEILEDEYPDRTAEILATYRDVEKRGGSAYAALAWAGIMRNTTDPAERIEYARRIRQAGGLSSDDTDEASYYEALGMLDSGATSDALTLLDQLAASPQSLAGARAAVTLGEYYVKAGRPADAVKLLSTFTSSGTPHQYELARGYIALADAYYAQGKKQLAREYISSLRDNYPGDEADIANMINQRLSKWK